MAPAIMGLPFLGIGPIVPELHEDGTPIEHMPQPSYKNTSNLQLHEHGKGPFCRFRIPAQYDGKAGVYVITVNGLSKYVGKCENLAVRFNTGYGNISPRKCYIGGHETNCRLNSLILAAFKKGSRIDLLFYQTVDRSRVEASLITHLKPEWNKTATLRRTGDAGGSPSGNESQPLRRKPRRKKGPDIDTIWRRIEAHAGQVFHRVRGGRFTYFVTRSAVIPNRTDQRLPKYDFEEALAHVPLETTVPVQHLRGPSYIYAILMDDRIRQTDW